MARLAACPLVRASALIVAALAALAAARRRRRGGALRGRASTPERPTAVEPQPRKGFPPLALSLGVRDDAEARELRRAVELYEAGRRDGGGDGSSRASTRSRRSSAPRSRTGRRAQDRIEQLGALYPAQRARPAARRARPLLGGHGRGAERLARGARRRARHALRGARGATCSIREFAPGLPVFVPSFPYRDRGREHAGGAARGAARRPDRARTPPLRRRAAAARPARLGAARLRRGAAARAERRRRARRGRGRPLRRRATRRRRSAGSARSRAVSRSAATVRFHLGVLLLWQGDVQEAKRQLRLARQSEPGSRIAREAGRYLTSSRKSGPADRKIGLTAHGGGAHALARLPQLCKEMCCEFSRIATTVSAIGGGAEVSAGVQPTEHRHRRATGIRRPRDRRGEGAARERPAGREAARRRHRERARRARPRRGADRRVLRGARGAADRGRRARRARGGGRGGDARSRPTRCSSS